MKEGGIGYGKGVDRILVAQGGELLERRHQESEQGKHGDRGGDDRPAHRG